MPSTRLVRVLRSVAANVRAHRLVAGMTQENLAEAADLDLNSLRRIETARTNASIGTLLKLSDALDVELAELFRPAQLMKPRRGRPPKHTG